MRTAYSKQNIVRARILLIVIQFNVAVLPAADVLLLHLGRQGALP